MNKIYDRGFQRNENNEGDLVDNSGDRTQPTANEECERGKNNTELKPEGQRTKEEEWEACYKTLFNQLNPIMEENNRLKEIINQNNY